MSAILRFQRRIYPALRTTARFNSTVPPKVPPPTPTESKFARWRRTVGRVTLGTIILGVAVFSYSVHKDHNPPQQLPYDAEKKTLVILGSGWGATSLLKKINTDEFNVVVVSPKNYFLFTPLLPSVAVGTIGRRAVMQSTRYTTRFKSRTVGVYEAEAESIDHVNKTVTFVDTSPIQGDATRTTIKYDYLVNAVGAEVQTFGIPGVQERACFMKELHDAEKAQRVFMDCIESAAFPGQSDEEIKRLLHFVVVGGGPTGIELAGEFHDFLVEDLRRWYPELANHVKITLVEALPSVLPMFSKQLIDYTLSTFKASNIDVLTKTMVKEVKPKAVVLQMPDGSINEVPVGMVFWAGGNKQRKVTTDLMASLPETQKNRRGLTVDNHFSVAGTDGTVFAIGDCTSTAYAPTAQVASQQGKFLASMFNRIGRQSKIEREIAAIKGNSEEDVKQRTALERQLEKAKKQKEFHYSHQGSLAYIGSDKAIADVPFFNGNFASGGVATFLFWRSAYLSTLFSIRNRTLVANEWIKTKIFGRDVSRDD
ncbi:putative NDE1-mitochondrial cytosolically directed NADH dehydrogenase [Flagelloscypha sp. PMI_526]|nr:putative NDE1-mitochondrial cytosolically directed NADH dehydrogenase [Flagelloscypha sp. PMI_526]